MGDMSLDELNEREDDIDEDDERMFEEYRYFSFVHLEDRE